jgi:hypothetical protein
MPFGLSVTSAFCQRFINLRLFKFMNVNIYCELDYNLKATLTVEENEILVNKVITKLESQKLRSHVTKWEFYNKEREFFGLCYE